MLPFKILRKMLKEAPELMARAAYSQADNYLGRHGPLELKKGKTNKRLDVVDHAYNDDTKHEYKEIGSTGTHKLYRSLEGTDEEYGGSTRHAHFLAVDKKTGKPHMKVSGYFDTKKKKLEIHSLKGHPDTTIKAHDFYHHLLLAGHVKELHSDATQSEGGKKVWQRLSKLPHVKMRTNQTKGFGKFENHYANQKQLAKAREKHRDEYGVIDWEKHYNDPEIKKLYRLRDRKLIAKPNIKEESTFKPVKQQLEKGKKVEHEHTNKDSVAKKIALAHIQELPDYYDRLKKVETNK